MVYSLQGWLRPQTRWYAPASSRGLPNWRSSLLVCALLDVWLVPAATCAHAPPLSPGCLRMCWGGGGLPPFIHPRASSKLTATPLPQRSHCAGPQSAARGDSSQQRAVSEAGVCVSEL